MKASSLNSLDFVPFDYIKGEIQNSEAIEFMLNHPDLSFSRNINEDTGEVNEEDAYKRIAKLHNMRFVYITSSKRMFIKGSVHVLYNILNGNGRHNKNRFTKPMLRDVFKYFKNHFLFDEYDIHLTNVEFGINIILAMFNISKIIKHCMFHKGVGIKKHSEKYDGDCMIFFHAEFNLKLYEKADGVIRFEIHFKKFHKYAKQYLNGEQNLGKILDLDQTFFASYLLKKWNEIVMYDPYIITDDQKVLITRDINYLLEYKEKRSRSSYNREIKKMKEYSSKYGKNIQHEISLLMSKEINNCQ